MQICAKDFDFEVLPSSFELWDQANLLALWAVPLSHCNPLSLLFRHHPTQTSRNVMTQVQMQVQV